MKFSEIYNSLANNLFNFFSYFQNSLTKLRTYDSLLADKEKLTIENKEFFARTCELVSENEEITEQREFLLELYDNDINREELHRRVDSLESLCGLQKGVIAKIRRNYSVVNKHYVDQIKTSFRECAEKFDPEVSYVVIGGYDTIVASTPEFRRKFGFNSIEGKTYFDFLKVSDNSKFDVGNIKEFFRNPQKMEFNTIIIDGRGQERVVHLVKREPYRIDSIGLGQDGDILLGDKLATPNYYFTRVDIKEVGFIKKFGGGLASIVHSRAKPRTMQEFIDFEQSRKIEEEGRRKEHEASQKNILAMFKKGLQLSEVDSFWEQSKGDKREYYKLCAARIKEIKSSKRK